MGCHHHVDSGACPVCDRVDRIKLNPPIVEFRPLHLQEGPGPLCDSEMGPDDRYSTLEIHDTERFCKLCLLRLRAREREEAKAALKAWKSREFSEKVRNFHAMLANTSDGYNAPFVLVFKTFALGGLVLVAALTTVFLSWPYALAFSVVYLFAIWRLGVAIS